MQKKRFLTLVLLPCLTFFSRSALAIMAVTAAQVLVVRCVCNPWSIVSVNRWVVTHVNRHVDRWSPGDHVLIENHHSWQLYRYHALYGRFFPTGVGSRRSDYHGSPPAR